MSELEKKAQLAKEYEEKRADFKRSLKSEDYPGTISIVKELDDPVCVVLKDGRTLRGVLTSFDEFGNIVIDRTTNVYYDSDMKLKSLPIKLTFITADQVALVGKLNKRKEQFLYDDE